MGAWIETTFIPNGTPSAKVAPLVGAWIETDPQATMQATRSVAPLVGAWIETWTPFPVIPVVSVAPLVGAWIETLANSSNVADMKSHPSWVRGLKLPIFAPENYQ